MTQGTKKSKQWYTYYPVFMGRKKLSFAHVWLKFGKINIKQYNEDAADGL
jgi:hypothetical protein